MNYLGLGVVCAVSAIIAAWMLANSRYSVVLRGLSAIIIMLLALAIWQHIGGLFGYPVAALPPDNSMLESSVIERDSNAIYLWVVPPGHHRPRSFVVPYSRQLAKELKQAEDAIHHGDIVHLHTGSHADGHGVGVPNSPGGHPGGIESSRQAPNITITVKPLLPDKS